MGGWLVWVFVAVSVLFVWGSYVGVWESYLESESVEPVCEREIRAVVEGARSDRAVEAGRAWDAAEVEALVRVRVEEAGGLFGCDPETWRVVGEVLSELLEGGGVVP